MAHIARLDIEAIQKRLPHRYPFLLIDRVLELNAQHAVALKNVTANEEFFVGHFPGKPIMPAVLIIEGMAQTAGLMHQESYPSSLGYLVGVDEARIRRQVVPGDQLRFEVELVRQKQKLCKAKAKATVGGELVAEALISLVAEDPAS